MIYDSIEQLIGNTPLLRIPKEVHQLQNIELYAKLEYYNPFGSVKDRVAWGMLRRHVSDLIGNEKTVLESSSGNTAKALSVLCSKNSIPFETVTNRIKYPEVRGVLQVLGAQLEELPGLSDCPHPFDPNDAIQYSRDKASRDPDKYHLTDQYFNEDNPNAHFETTGKELIDDLGRVDYFFGFLGTCGSTYGIGKYLRETYAEASVFGIVGKPGHTIPGGRTMEELWEVGFFNKEFYSEIIAGTTAEAIDGALTLNRKCGVLCGPTTGLIFAKALEKLKTLDAACTEKKSAVIIACDRMEPYLSFFKKHRPELFATKPRTQLSVDSLTEEQVKQASEVTVPELKTLIAERDPFLVDIRGYFAFSTGHIPGSINILDDNFGQMIEGGMVFPKNRPIVVVCRVGDISKKYAAFLKRQGYEAYSLTDGVQAYKNSNSEVEQSIGA